MGFAKPIEQYLFGNLLTKMHVFMYLKDIIRGVVIMVGTAIVLVILIVVVTIATKSLIKDKKNGKSISCGGDCKNCHGCH